MRLPRKEKGRRRGGGLERLLVVLANLQGGPPPVEQATSVHNSTAALLWEIQEVYVTIHILELLLQSI